MKKQILALLIVPVMVLTACNKDDDEITTPANSNGELKLSITNLAELAADEQYDLMVKSQTGPIYGQFDISVGLYSQFTL